MAIDDRYVVVRHESDPHKLTVADRETETASDLTLRGRWVYVRKTVRPERVGGIVVPEKTRENNTFAEVLAVGVGCGQMEPGWKRKTRAEKVALRRRADWLLQVENPLAVGDTVAAPDNHAWGIMLSPYNAHEFFLHECVITSVVE